VTGTMVRGRCVGGPYDGLVVDAEPGWSGLVTSKHSAGRYLLDHDDDPEGCASNAPVWRWVGGPVAGFADAAAIASALAAHPGLPTPEPAGLRQQPAPRSSLLPTPEPAVARWLADRCVLRPDAQTSARTLYESWQAWAGHHGVPPRTAPWLGWQLTQQGVGSRDRRRGGRYLRMRVGVELRPPP
jgi:hypothetical protein